MVLKIQTIVILLLFIVINTSYVLAQSAVDWNKKGIELYDQGKYEEAIKCFNKALDGDHENVDTWYNKGNALDNLEKYEEAIRCYDKVIQIDSNYVNAWSLKGLDLYYLGKYEEAIKCYDKVLEINPSDANTWFSKGDILSLQGKNKEAIKCYNKSLEINPNSTLLSWRWKGINLSLQEKDKEAIKCYDKALEINPNYKELWNDKGLSLFFQRKYEEAIKCYDKALEIDPNYAEVWNNKGNTLHIQRKYEEAIKCFDKALEIDPNYVYAKANKEKALEALGKPQSNDVKNSNNKLKDFATLVILINNQTYKGETFLNDTGYIYTSITDIGKALNFNYTLDNEILTINGKKYEYEYQKNNNKIYIQLTTISMLLGCSVDYKEETNTLNIYKVKSLAEEQNEKTSTLLEKALNMLSKNDYERAIYFAEQVLTINPKQCLALCIKGTSLIEQGYPEEGFKIYEETLKINPNYALTWYLKGSFYEEKLKKEDALYCYKKSLEIDPDNADAWVSIGHILYTSGDCEKAVECYTKALEIDPKHTLAIKYIDEASNHIGYWNNYYNKKKQAEQEKLANQITVGCLTLIDYRLERSDYSKYIVGTIKNNSGNMLSYAEIDFILYDHNGYQVDSSFTNINNLEPYGVWKFKALVLEDKAVKIKVVDLKYSL